MNGAVLVERIARADLEIVIGQDGHQIAVSVQVGVQLAHRRQLVLHFHACVEEDARLELELEILLRFLQRLN